MQNIGAGSQASGGTQLEEKSASDCTNLSSVTLALFCSVSGVHQLYKQLELLLTKTWSNLHANSSYPIFFVLC